MSRKGKDIRSFFQPSSSQAPAPQAATRERLEPEQRRRRQQSPRNHAASSARATPDFPSLPSSPVPAATAATTAAVTVTHPSGLHPSSLPSSPQTPRRTDATGIKKGSLKRDDEIKGSDEDTDGDGNVSDSSVESLSAIFGLSKPSPKYERPAQETATPQAKRVASLGVYGHKSPLTLQQRLRRGGAGGGSGIGAPGSRPVKKRKFDMKALLQHAREDERAEESARRAQELIDMPDDDDDEGGKGGSDSDVKAGRGTTNLQEKARAILQGDGDDETGEKLVRAIDRTKSKPTRRCCYFFSPKLSPSAIRGKRAPFPLTSANGRWKFLRDPTTRDQSMIHHIPQTLVARGFQIPEALLLWLIGEACVEPDAQLRLRYCDIVTLCGERAARLVTANNLYTLLEGLGGPRGREEDGKFVSTMEMEEAYTKRDWGPLVSFLRMLVGLAPFLSEPFDAILLLLRMSLDPICGTVVRHEHAVALQALVMCLPETSVPQLAAKICDYVARHISEMVLKAQAVNSIPKTTARLQSLWRSVAQGILFGSAAHQNGLTLDMILERLKQHDFAINQDTDFEEFRSLVLLLDSAIGNAAFLRIQGSSPLADRSCSLPVEPEHIATSPNTIVVSAAASPASAATAKPAAAAHYRQAESKADANRRFDAAVDALTRRIEVLQNKIHDSNSPERKEAKTSLDALAKRLAYSVRTRPPAKTSIFDVHLLRNTVLGRKMKQDEEEQTELPKQRDFMKNWAVAATTPSALVDKKSKLNAVLVDGETGLSHNVL
ncbi:uncharacterized protein B0I36DRAFT_359270 [Microdochium trichocladiopsis]|uniref:Uncharacterized protein n=1 Tax=Microdochium trichocladiopsis TaxID=1682393 RepID=A0A9P8YDR8_9PEZI|nr:uncharacterized protein B0I36DRAFT_359270 [Microdochium trichocladiopsis]KAH7037595.1 hypothetical protein B0I36DRAFT_359270 [Microdochium trichocladiopsis]